MRNLRNKIIIVFIALSLIILGYWVYSTHKPVERDLNEIRKEGIIRIVTEYGPLGYYVDGDSIKGFQYELLNRFADSLGLQVEFTVENNLEKSIEGLNKGWYDVMARSMPITTELRELVTFSDPILKNKQVLIQRTQQANNGIEPIRNQLYLARKTLYVPEKSPFLLRISNLAKEIGDSIYIKEIPNYETEQLIIMVAKGDIDYAVSDESIARISARDLPEIDIKTAVGFTQLEGWAVRQSSPDLLNEINLFIEKQLIIEGISTLYDKYNK